MQPSWFWNAVSTVHLSLLAGLVAISQAQAQSSFPDGISPPGTVQNVAMGYFDEFGQRHDLNDIVGDLIVVNVWATWCVPCVTELPSLGKLRSAVAQDGIEVFALSVDRGGVPKTRRFFEQHGRPDLNYGFDPRGVFLDQLGNAVLPTTLVLQRDGQILAVSQRALDWSAPEVAAWLRRLKTPES